MLETSLAARKKAPAADFSLAIINVVFLLLFFFILTGSVVQRTEMGIEAPFTKTLPLEKLPRPLITVSAQNNLFLDGVEITLDALQSRITHPDKSTKTSFTELNILSEGSLSARTFLKTINTLRSTGLPIRIVTIRTKRAAAQ